jgi:SET domain
MANDCDERSKGYIFFRDGNNYKALLCYNRSLLNAKKSGNNINLALAYGNRSAVYIAMHEFTLCLENIKLAKDYGYPRDKLPRLIEREENCKKLMKEAKKPDPDDDPRNFFKLSYPANRKVPFIIDGLEMREDEKFGRGIYTTRDLKAGDIIAIEEPFFFALCSSKRDQHFEKRCAMCMKGNKLSLTPHAESKLKKFPFYPEIQFSVIFIVMFCSDECLDDFKLQMLKIEQLGLPFYQYEHDELMTIIQAMSASGGDLEVLHSIFTDPKSTTVFDYDLSDWYNPETKLNLLKCVASLQQRAKNDRFSAFDKYSGNAIETLNLFIKRVFDCSWIGNVFNVESHGTSLSPFLSLINHSCDHNAEMISIDSATAFLLNRPVKAGEQICTCYE